MMEEIKAKVPELAKHLRDDHEAFDSKKPDPLDVLSLKKSPITDGGLVDVEPEIEPVDSMAKVADSTEKDSVANDSSMVLRGGTIAEALTIKYSESQRSLVIPHSASTGRIQLFDMRGKVVFESAFHRGNSAETFVLPPSVGAGVYYLKIRSGNALKMQRMNIVQ